MTSGIKAKPLLKAARNVAITLLPILWNNIFAPILIAIKNIAIHSNFIASCAIEST